MNGFTISHSDSQLLNNRCLCFFVRHKCRCNFCQSQLSKDLQRSPDSLEDLKFVLAVISNIKAMSLDVEMRIADLTERLHS